MPKVNAAAADKRLIKKIKELGPWFHNLHLNGVQTAPDHSYGDFPMFKWNQFKNHIPKDLGGFSVLDIGCNAGFYSFELAKRGAQVIGIDLDPHYLKQARWAAKELNLEKQVSFKQMQVYDISRLKNNFDIIIFMGVFYHLRYPMLALDIISQKVNRMMIFQTLTMPGETIFESGPDMDLLKRNNMLKKGWPAMAFIENKLAGDPTNWWAPNKSCILAMLRTCGLKVTANPGHEIYIAKRDDKLISVAKGWNHSEYLSAIGQKYTSSLKHKLKH